MDVKVKQQREDVVGFEDPVTLTMTRLEAHRIYGELEELDLHGISPEFVEMSNKLKKVVEASKK